MILIGFGTLGQTREETSPRLKLLCILRRRSLFVQKRDCRHKWKHGTDAAASERRVGGIKEKYSGGRRDSPVLECGRPRGPKPKGTMLWIWRSLAHLSVEREAEMLHVFGAGSGRGAAVRDGQGVWGRVLHARTYGCLNRCRCPLDSSWWEPGAAAAEGRNKGTCSRLN